MGSIVWLASYPKSGSTWVRVLLANYLHAAESPADINDLPANMRVAASRILFDDWAGVEASALDQAMIDRLRPEVYRRMAEESDQTLFVKVHDIWGTDDRDRPIFPAEATAAVVYIVRHPLDVAVSCAHHWDIPASEAVERLRDPATRMGVTGASLADQIAQRIGSWSSHARSWLMQSGLPCHVVRYEDLRRDPGPTFGALVRACGLPHDEDRIGRAVQRSDFDVLQRQERERGFRERSVVARGAFFRRGQVGSWRSELPPGPAARLRASERAMMTHFGYDGGGT